MLRKKMKKKMKEMDQYSSSPATTAAQIRLIPIKGMFLFSLFMFTNVVSLSCTYRKSFCIFLKKYMCLNKKLLYRLFYFFFSRYLFSKIVPFICWANIAPLNESNCTFSVFAFFILLYFCRMSEKYNCRSFFYICR